jgi:hypothetical protein
LGAHRSANVQPRVFAGGRVGFEQRHPRAHAGDGREPIGEDRLHVDVLCGARAQKGDGLFIEPTAEIRAQQKLAVVAHPRAQRQQAVLFGPALGQHGSHRFVRHGELRLKLQHDVGRVARAHGANADQRGGVCFGAFGKACGGRLCRCRTSAGFRRGLGTKVGSLPGVGRYRLWRRRR